MEPEEIINTTNNEQPEVYVPPEVIDVPGDKWRVGVKKVKPVVMLVWMVVGLAAILAGFKYFQSISSKAATYTSSLRLPSIMNAEVGSVVSVPLFLDTRGAEVSGVDVLMSFDIAKLELVSITPVAGSSTSIKYFAPADATGIFKAADVVYKANSVGLIEFGAGTIDYAAQKTLPTFNGIVNLVDLKFKTKVVGTATVNLQMTAGSTKDSNIVVPVGGPVDALASLSQITNLTLTVTSVLLPTPTPITVFPSPSVAPTSAPILTPTLRPTLTPTIRPTPTPTPRPTSVPTGVPVPPTPTPIGSSQPVTINPIKDTYVSNNAQSTSYATSSILYVDGSPKMVTYMTFDLSAYGNIAVSEAKLSFKTTSGGYSGSPNKFEVYAVDNTSWAENVTYNNKPVVSTTKLGEGLINSSNTVYGVTLSNSYVSSKLGGLMSLAIVPTGSDALYFYSRESSVFKPQLSLNLGISSGSVISIFAAGSPADGVYPKMDLLVNDVVVASYSNVTGNISSRNFVEFRYVHPQKVTHNQVKVRFTNDLRNSSGDRDLVVDRVEIDGLAFQSESLTVYGTGVWTSSTGCTTGYLSTEWLYCNGYFLY